jgi:hypothetical protein
MIWTVDADSLLVKLWDEGGSLGYVAEGMRRAGYAVTRNAVAGRKHRLLIARAAKFTRTTPHSSHTIRPQPFVKLRPIQRSKLMTEKVRPPTIEELQARAQNIEGVEYLSNPINGCKAILDRPKGGEWMLAMCCGKPRNNGSPYCRTHLALYTNAAPIPRKHHG